MSKDKLLQLEEGEFLEIANEGIMNELIKRGIISEKDSDNHFLGVDYFPGGHESRLQVYIDAKDDDNVDSIDFIIKVKKDFFD